MDRVLDRVLYDHEVACRSDIDLMENAIRDARQTTMSGERSSSGLAQGGSLVGGTKRCSVLETAAYNSMRMSLLRWISDREVDGGAGLVDAGVDMHVDVDTSRCNIGSGILVICEHSVPPRVKIVWRCVWLHFLILPSFLSALLIFVLPNRHLDSDGTLPVTDGAVARGPGGKAARKQPPAPGFGPGEGGEDDDDERWGCEQAAGGGTAGSCYKRHAPKRVAL